MRVMNLDVVALAIANGDTDLDVLGRALPVLSELARIYRDVVVVPAVAGLYAQALRNSCAKAASR